MTTELAPDSLAGLLLAYLRAFARRRDVVIVEQHIHGEPLADTQTLRDNMPADLVELYTRLNGLEWTWVFATHEAERAHYSKGYQGGRINLAELGPRGLSWYARDEWVPGEHDEHAWWDSVVEEGYTLYVRPTATAVTSAHPAFNDLEELTPFKDVHEYLTTGARRGFVWYWQRGWYWEAQEFTNTLLHNSPPDDTPLDALHDALIARGAPVADADALISWLGEDARILVDLR